MDEQSLRSTALLDWEDACEGPLVYDLATAVVGGCFDSAGALQAGRVRGLFAGYGRQRSLLAQEWERLGELMWVNALVVGAYRFRQVSDPITL